MYTICISFLLVSLSLGSLPPICLNDSVYAYVDFFPPNVESVILFYPIFVKNWETEKKRKVKEKRENRFWEF